MFIVYLTFIGKQPAHASFMHGEAGGNMCRAKKRAPKFTSKNKGRVRRSLITGSHENIVPRKIVRLVYHVGVNAETASPATGRPFSSGNRAFAYVAKAIDGNPPIRANPRFGTRPRDAEFAGHGNRRDALP